MRNKAVAIILAGMLLGVPAFAGAPSASTQDNHATVVALQSRLDALQRTTPKKGAMAQMELSRQKHQINDMIKRLESGQSVDPDELNRLLRETQ